MRIDESREEREEISSKLFNEVVGDPGHTLHKLLPPKNPARPIDAKNLSFLVTFSVLSSV